MLHVAVPRVDWLREQLPVKLPEPVGATEKFTEPVGVIRVPLDASLTVAVHVVD
jgi:hypothetical protein